MPLMNVTPRLYVDSSVIAGCCDPHYTLWTRSLLQDFQKGLYRPFISTLVQAEMADAPRHVLEAYAELLRCEPKIINVSEKADVLADLYIERKVLDPGYYFDALHVALATLEEVDVFVSLDHPHMLHFAQVRGFVTVNIELGLKPIQIRCPRLVASHDRESY